MQPTSLSPKIQPLHSLSVPLSSDPFSVFVAGRARQHSLEERWPFSLTTATESSFWAAGSARAHTQTHTRTNRHTLWWLIEILKGLDHLQCKATPQLIQPALHRNPMKENLSAEVESKERNQAWAQGNWQIPSWQGSWSSTVDTPTWHLSLWRSLFSLSLSDCVSFIKSPHHLTLHIQIHTPLLCGSQQCPSKLSKFCRVLWVSTEKICLN